MAKYGKSERTKKHIFDVAHALFLRNGYQATSLNDVAKAAGVAKGTLYNHYPSKSDLLMEQEHLSVERLREMAKDIPADLPLIERICMLAQYDFEGVSSGVARADVLAGENDVVTDLALASRAEAYASFDRLREEYDIREELRLLYEGLIVQAQEAGSYDAQASAHDLSALVIAAYFQELDFVILDHSYDFAAGMRAKLSLFL